MPAFLPGANQPTVLSLLGMGMLAALTVLTVSCAQDTDSSNSSQPAAGPEASRKGLELEIAMQMLSTSWMQHAAADPDRVTELIDAPGGGGWLRLFHGDLAGAEEQFLAAKPTVDVANKGSARAGQARVHLARARTLLRVAALQQDAAVALVRYRHEHRGQVRQGPYDQVLSQLVLQGAGQPAAIKETSTQSGGGYQNALRALFDARQSESEVAPGALHKDLPETYRQRLLFVHAMSVGEVARAESFLPAVLAGGEDIQDPLGEDSEAGVTFRALYFDPQVPLALARYNLAQAWILGAGLQGPGESIARAVQLSWGAPVPEAVRSAALPSAGAQPDWLALFLGPAIDLDDWGSYWGGREDARSFLSVLQDQMPEVPWLEGTSANDVDKLLRAAADLEPVLRDALIQSVGSEGASLSQDLGFAATTLDRLLRTRVSSLVENGHALQAKRLAERSLDMEPTRLGGVSTSAATRVSYRNDRGFLIDLAHCLWKAGQVDASLSYIHPLRDEDPQLGALAYYLGQLDAARSIRIQGKTSQQ